MQLSETLRLSADEAMGIQQRVPHATRIGQIVGALVCSQNGVVYRLRVWTQEDLHSTAGRDRRTDVLVLGAALRDFSRSKESLLFLADDALPARS